MSEVDEILGLASTQDSETETYFSMVAMRVVADLQAVHGLNHCESSKAFELVLGMLNEGVEGPFEAYLRGDG